ncbi:hypothetical protein WQ54_03375 [Bacillus sp. SA1-12]|uniref:hypothetical protein n=1 Tax=Bacillus sp. SA1-12 TaxID=1455638 RepID=UPI000626AAF4|nr:hypothetical protein [Bacillus sp. SA1-12]KKI93661.1 hypothetical protein WQ54_03375 [Bacillus sp. SA1-12]
MGCCGKRKGHSHMSTSMEVGEMSDMLSILRSKRKKKHHKKKKDNGNGVVCDGCACTFLVGREEEVFNLLLEGNDNFLNLAGNGGNRTDFEFQGFEDCCAIFTFESTGQTEETFVVDCRCICALVPVND